ncbi:uncharacterized protein LOC131025894 [Salvia miltiorrhiza]|uniref:uncharacterized protein LOC131025894 n=1 Tax=Salvia miltiorrhiza TaxID=226208 RepID=UPI0025AC87D6|nr:uncharacterized protein LOC131025894 [Salvia miltiorrhiza]
MRDHVDTVSHGGVERGEDVGIVAVGVPADFIRSEVAVLDGWTPPRTTDENGVTYLTPESRWSADERLIPHDNSRALNAIFISVDVSAFSMISNCTEALDAWLILQEQCEGSASVRATKMRMLTTKFEVLRMREDESISAYYEKLCEISNEAVGLGEPISNERLVSKMLRSLPERYNMKISSIEETTDVATMRVGDLVSKLVTFEMNLEQQKTDHLSKSVAFRVEKPSVNPDFTNMSEFTDVDHEEKDDANIAMLVKIFNNMLKSLKKEKFKSDNRKPSGMSVGSSSNITSVKKNVGSTSEVRSVDHIQCMGCQGMGHYANKCPTVARKRHPSLTATLSDDSDSEEEMVLLFATVDEDEIPEEGMIGALEDLDDEISLSDEYVESETLNVDNNGSSIDSDIDLFVESEIMNDVDVTNTDVNISSENAQSGLLVDKNVVDMDTDFQKIDGMKIPINTTNCYQKNVGNTGRFDFSRLFDERKKNEICNVVVYTSLNANITENCYFDSGGKVTFGGGAKGTILGKGVLNVTDFSKLKDMYLVEGLKANLISISQLCDAGMTVEFDKHLYEVFDDTNSRVMMGKRSFDNCYKSQEETICNAAKLDDVELWHQRLGHINFKNLQKLLTHDVILGLPKLDIKKDVKLYKGSEFNIGQNVGRIRTDHGKEFENSLIDDFCTNNGIFHEFSAPKSPQQNGVAERNNRTIQEMVRAMLQEKSFSKRLRAEAFDSKSDKGLFLGYSVNSHAYRVYNLRTKTIQETVNVVFDNALNLVDRAEDEDIAELLEESNVTSQASDQQKSASVDTTSVPTSDVTFAKSTSEGETSEYVSDSKEEQGARFLHDLIRRDPPGHVRRNHPNSLIIGDAAKNVVTRQKKDVNYKEMVRIVCMTSDTILAGPFKRTRKQKT